MSVSEALRRSVRYIVPADLQHDCNSLADIDPVAFKSPSPEQRSVLVSNMLALKDKCQRDGKPYIRELKGGKQHSPEGMHHDMDVVFVVTFEVSFSLVVVLYFFKSYVEVAIMDPWCPPWCPGLAIKLSVILGSQA